MTLSVKVASVGQNRPTKWQKTSITHGTFQGKIESKKFSREEYHSMLMAQHQQLHELWKKARLLNGKKTPESSTALEARVAELEVKRNNRSNESLFADEKPKTNNRNNLALDKREMAPDRAVKILDG